MTGKLFYGDNLEVLRQKLQASISLILRKLEQVFGQSVLQSINLDGIPRDMASARALANKADDRLRKEFEKWAVLTYSNNRARINEKKGADQGIDGLAYFAVGRKDNGKIVFQVKSGKVDRGDVAKLNNDRLREKAELATLITLNTPTAPMLKEAKAAGQYGYEEMGRYYDRVSIVTVQEIIEDQKRLEMPMSLEVLGNARRDDDGEQLSLM